MKTKKTFHEIYKDIVHTKEEDKAACNATGATRFSEDLDKVTCRKCRKKRGMK